MHYCYVPALAQSEKQEYHFILQLWGMSRLIPTIKKNVILFPLPDWQVKQAKYKTHQKQ